MKRTHTVGLVLTAMATGLGGCQTPTTEEQDVEGRTTVVQPADFTAGTRERQESEPAQLIERMRANDQSMTEPEAPPPPAPTAAPEPATVEPEIEAQPQPGGEPVSSAGQALTVDAMIGQVNGRPLYASRVLEPIDEQLAALGRNPDVPPVIFRQQAAELIRGRLQQLVTDQLILGEAERDLNAQERAGLQHMMKEQLNELLRLWGKGSRALADRRLLEETGKGLDQTLEERRQQVVVQRFLRQTLIPKINITRKDIERYYRDHHDQFNRPATRTVRLIRVPDAAAAEKVEAALAQKPFTEVASSDELNSYKPEQAGLFAEDLAGEELFGDEALNKATLSLDQGEHAGPLAMGSGQVFVFVENIEGGSGRSLRETQIEIEETLRRQRFQQLSNEYREGLFRSGVFDSIDQMTEALVKIASTRYSVARAQ